MCHVCKGLVPRSLTLANNPVRGAALHAEPSFRGGQFGVSRAHRDATSLLASPSRVSSIPRPPKKRGKQAPPLPPTRQHNANLVFRFTASCVACPRAGAPAHFLAFLAAGLAAGFLAAGFLAAAFFGAGAGFFAAAATGFAAGFTGAGAGGAGAAFGAAALAAGFLAGAACAGAKHEVSTSKIVHTDDGKCLRRGGAEAPAASARARLGLGGGLGLRSNGLRGRACARRRGVMNAQFAHQLASKCASLPRRCATRLLLHLGRLGCHCLGSRLGRSLGRRLLGRSLCHSVHGARARQHRSRSRPAGGARTAGGAPGERKVTRTEQGGVRDGRRAGPTGGAASDSTSAAVTYAALLAALAKAKLLNMFKKCVSTYQRMRCAASRRCARHVDFIALAACTCKPAVGVSPDATRAGSPSTRRLPDKTW